MLMSSMSVEVVAIVLTAILLAADWYIWDPRYRISRPCGTDLANRLVTQRKDKIHSRSAAAGALIAPVDPQSLQSNVRAEPVQGSWMEQECSHGRRLDRRVQPKAGAAISPQSRRVLQHTL